ncbi:MAG TPA: HEAT repeat domain-containing protein [Phycisphaerae bacterium]|nr:HEAT repeat domain-containing protein [Phycisphaerae bacterium]
MTSRLPVTLTALAAMAAASFAGDAVPAPDRVAEQIELMRSSSPATRANAAQALGEMRPKAIAAVGALKERSADEGVVGLRPTINGMPRLELSIQFTTTVGRVAATALYRIDPAAGVDVLRTGPVSARSAVAAAASENINDSFGLDAALLAARDRAGSVRLEGVRGLVRSTDPRALKAVLEATRDAAPQIRGEAFDAIGKRADRAQHVDRLLDVMLRDGHHNVRGVAAYHLGEFDDPRLIPPLITALKDPHAFVREQAADSLSRHPSDQVIEAFIHALKDPHRDVLLVVLKALLCFRDPRASAAAVGLTNHDNLDVRILATTLVGCYPDQHVDVLLRALEDKRSHYIRSAAAEALGQTAKPDARIVPALVRRYRNAPGGTPGPARSAPVREYGEANRTHCCWALATLGTPEAVNALEELLLDESHPVLERALVARALGTTGTPKARAALARFTDHPNDPLSRDARQGLEEGATKYKRTPTLHKLRPRNHEAGAAPPFYLRWSPSDLADGGSAARTGGASAAGLVLSGIVGSGAGGAAIINGRIVRVGDEVAGRKVVEITRYTVRLDVHGKEILLTMK